MYDEYVDRVSEVVTGIVQQAGDRNNVLVDLGKVEALLPRSEQVDGERYEQGSRIKAVITEVRSGTKGPQVILSQARPGADQDALRARGPRDRRRPRRDPRRRPRAGLPLEDRRRVARPGRRSRSAPASARAARASAWSCPSCAARRSTSSRGTPSRRASSPRRSRPRACARCSWTTRRSEATVVVPDDQLSLAIGKEGLNARLAARLTGWKIDIVSETEFARSEAEAAFGGAEDEFSGPLRGHPLDRQALPEHGASRLALLRHPRPPRARRARGGRARTSRRGRRSRREAPERPAEDEAAAGSAGERQTEVAEEAEAPAGAAEE